MKIICNSQLLTEACLNVQHCVPGKSVIPHLEGILIQTESDNRIMLSGFDMDLGITTHLSVHIEEAGACVLNAKTFCDILRHLPGESVSIQCNEKYACVIKSGNAEYSLAGLNPAEYPELPQVTDEKQFTVSQLTLREMIRQTIFAVSSDDSKAIHKGIKFEVNPGELNLVALDGFRLAIRSEFTEYNDQSFSFVVPAKTLAEVMKLINDEALQISVKIGQHHIIFGINDYFLVSRLLEGEFLDYRSAVPTAKSTVIRIKTKELIDCIERASILITEKTKSPIRCIFDDNCVKISTVTALGSANDRIDASIDGKRAEIGFNNRFLLDALRSCDTDEVLIHLNGSVAPAIILPPESQHFLYLILPVRLKND